MVSLLAILSLIWSYSKSIFNSQFFSSFVAILAIVAAAQFVSSQNNIIGQQTDILQQQTEVLKETFESDNNPKVALFVDKESSKIFLANVGDNPFQYKSISTELKNRVIGSNTFSDIKTFSEVESFPISPGQLYDLNIPIWADNADIMTEVVVELRDYRAIDYTAVFDLEINFIDNSVTDSFSELKGIYRGEYQEISVHE